MSEGENLYEQLLKRLDTCGKSRKEIAMKLEISDETLSRHVSGQLKISCDLIALLEDTILPERVKGSFETLFEYYLREKREGK